MPRRFVQAMYLLAIGIVLFVGFSIYRASQNTAQHAGQIFIQELIAGDITSALAQGTTTLQGKTAVVNQLAGQLRDANASSVYVLSKEPFYDTFNAYPVGSLPTRLVYELSIGDKKYHVVIVAYQENGDWKIDSVSRSYVQ